MPYGKKILALTRDLGCTPSNSFYVLLMLGQMPSRLLVDVRIKESKSFSKRSNGSRAIEERQIAR